MFFQVLYVGCRWIVKYWYAAWLATVLSLKWTWHHDLFFILVANINFKLLSKFGVWCKLWFCLLCHEFFFSVRAEDDHFCRSSFLDAFSNLFSPTGNVLGFVKCSSHYEHRWHCSFYSELVFVCVRAWETADSCIKYFRPVSLFVQRTRSLSSTVSCKTPFTELILIISHTHTLDPVT